MTAIFRKPPYAEYLHMSSSDKYAIMPFFHHTGSHVKMINLAFLKMLGSPYVVTMAFLSPVLRLKACRCHGCRCWGAGTCSNEATAGAAAIPKKGCLVSSNPPGKKNKTLPNAHHYALTRKGWSHAYRNPYSSYEYGIISGQMKINIFCTSGKNSKGQ